MDGYQAVEKFKALSQTDKRYSLILTDYSMPGLNGYEAAIQIREHCDDNNIEQPYIVAITGHTEENYVKKAFESRVDEIMSKPAKIDTVEQILGEIVKLMYWA